ncbi:MAG: carbonic anhydrase, partial [Bacillota bacterium]|nr:carbonic anhydrase [Bacillota bacterium]
IYTVCTYGGTVSGNEASLDYALRTMAVPVLVIFGHEDCSAVKGALRGSGDTRVFHDLFQTMAPAFDQGRARKFRDNVLKHIDYQVSLALDRYNDLVKAEKLVVAGLYSDNLGNLSLTNYNGLRGIESLCHALPDVDKNFFLE